jgi:hypothetical protein
VKKFDEFINETLTDEMKKWQKVVADHFFDNGFPTTIQFDTQGYLLVIAKFKINKVKMFTDDRQKVRDAIDFIEKIEKESVENRESEDQTTYDSFKTIHFTFDFRNGNVPNYFKSIAGLNKYKI